MGQTRRTQSEQNESACRPNSRHSAEYRPAPLRANFRHRLDFMLHSRRLWSSEGVQCGLHCQLKIGITRGAIVGAVQKFPRSVRPRIQIEDVSIDGYAASFFRRANTNNYARAESPITL